MCPGGKDCKCGKHKHLKLVRGKYVFIKENINKDSVPKVDSLEEKAKSPKKKDSLAKTVKSKIIKKGERYGRSR